MVNSSGPLLRSRKKSCVNGSQQQAIYRGCMSDVTATWAYDIMKYLDCWEIQVIGDKGRGIIAKKHIPKGAYIAIYGGEILDRKLIRDRGGSHALELKYSNGVYAIDGYECDQLPKLAQAALANEPDQGPSNSVIVWKGWSTKFMLNYLFEVPLLKTTKDILKGEEITHNYSPDRYITKYVAY